MLGQLPCWGCGFEAISCDLLSLLTKVTVWPTATDTVAGLTPFDVIVTVAPLGPPVPPSLTTTAVPPPPGDVEDPPPPPQAESMPRAARERTSRERRCVMRSLSLKELARNVEADVPRIG